jgi:dUTP pyrophosphatase
MELKIHRVNKEIDPPQYTRASDIAFDLRSAEEVLLAPGQKHIVKTGLRVAIPPGYAGLIWDRSGLSSKKEIHCLAGVIDPAYRGEIGVVLKNLGSEEYVISKNERIAQMLIQPAHQVSFVEVEELDEATDRKQNGFGSSGRF